MTHFSLSYLSNLICCHPSRFESNEYFCSNLLNKYIYQRRNENIERPPETRCNVDFVSNYSSAATTHRPVNSAPYYYGDIAHNQPNTSFKLDQNSTNYWNYNYSMSKYSIMDGLRVQLKNQVRNNNQYLRSPNVHRSDDFKVSLRGWLYRLEGAALKQWKRRWCVLADYCLFYYKDMAEEKMLGSLLLPSYKISPCFSRDGISRKFAFKAEHNNMKTYYFSADSKEIQQEWMNALSMASIMQLSAIFSSKDADNNNKTNNNTKDIENNNRVIGVNNKESTSEIRPSGAIEDESGFVAYHQAKRLDETSVYPINHHYNANFIPQYQMYNSVGLPVFYQDLTNHMNGYVNAPPKPQRQYYDLMLPYDLSSNLNPDFVDPNNYFATSDQNYVPYPDYLHVNPHQYNNYHLNTNVSYDQRLPPRPHSADFLERNQDFEVDDECQTLFMQTKKPDHYRSEEDAMQRILPMRPKSSIEKYYGMKNDFFEDSKMNPYLNKNMLQYDPRFLPVLDDDSTLRTPHDQNSNKVPNINNFHEMVPNRPPLPQEYVFRFQKNSNRKVFPDDMSTREMHTASVMNDITKFGSRNEETTYTSDDEIIRGKDSTQTLDSSMEPFLQNDQDPFELGKEEYYKASKLFYQRQNCSQTVSLNSGLSSVAESITSQHSSKSNIALKNDWNEIGLPIPNPPTNHIQESSSLLRKTTPCYSSSGNFPHIQNQSNEELEIKFKLGLNVRTYRKPKSYFSRNGNPSNHQPNNHIELKKGQQNFDINENPQQDQDDQKDIQTSPNILKHIWQKVENEMQVSNNSSAPYYYSDLLNEEQKIALQKKLGDFATPPPLLSRCTALDNTRFLGTTSLTLNKKPQKITEQHQDDYNNKNEFNDNKSDVGKNSSETLPIEMNRLVGVDNSNDNSKSKKINLENKNMELKNNIPQGAKVEDEEHKSSESFLPLDNNHIYENCSQTFSSNFSKSFEIQEKNDSRKHNSNNKTKQNETKSQNKIKISVSSSLDSLHEIPNENVKKKKRKRKSRENVSNVSDSEVQSNLEKTSSVRGLSKFSRRLSASAAEYVGKSHEELILMLIQLRRKQSQLSKACEKLRLQMDSEEKMMEIEPYRKDDYRLRFNELNRQWNEVNREYELQIPIIQTIDHMIKIKSKSKMNELNKKKAASTSILDKVSEESQQTNKFENKQNQSSDSDSNQTAETPNENIEILKKQQRVLESELDRVRGMLTHSTKKLEEKAVENAQMEQEMLIARNKLKQVLETEQEAMEITRSSKLEAELAHINKVIDDLHNRRKELNNAIENLKNSEFNFTKFSSQQSQPAMDEDSNFWLPSDEEEVPISKGETSLYPLYENIKKSKEFSKYSLSSNNDFDEGNDRTNNNLNDEFFTLNINLDKQPKMIKNIKNDSGEINNNDFTKNINTMCEFDPNKDMALAYGDSIVDQQIKQIYNYQPFSTKSNEVKTVREVKRESERRKFHQNQQINRSNVNTRPNYESYIQFSHHYFNDLSPETFADRSYLNDVKNQIKPANSDSDEQLSPRGFNAPDIVQSTIKLTDKT